MAVTKIPVIVRMCSTHCYPHGDLYKNVKNKVPIVCTQCQLPNLRFTGVDSYHRTQIFLKIQREIKDTEDGVIQFLNLATQKIDTLESWIEELRRE